MDQLKRITDLFTEGTEIYLGDDAGTPVVVWVNQLNSFETEDARLDGQLRRSERMIQLGLPESPEREGLLAELRALDVETIADRYAGMRIEEIMLDVYNDLETEPEFREVQELAIKMPAALEEAGAAADDPRRAQLARHQEKWTDMVHEARQKALQEQVKDAIEMGREDLIKLYVEKWRERATVEVFLTERRLTETWFALRECSATDVGDPDVDGRRKIWKHVDCDHSKRLVPDRAGVRSLPEFVLQKVSAAIGEMKIGFREAGNSDAPASSSNSSERPSTEDPSMVSIPVAPSTEPPTA